jgi:hypothetical protein
MMDLSGSELRRIRDLDGFQGQFARRAAEAIAQLSETLNQQIAEGFFRCFSHNHCLYSNHF